MMSPLKIPTRGHRIKTQIFRKGMENLVSTCSRTIANLVSLNRVDFRAVIPEVVSGIVHKGNRDSLLSEISVSTFCSRKPLQLRFPGELDFSFVACFPQKSKCHPIKKGCGQNSSCRPPNFW
jgi:hypothetical protein